MDTNLLVQTLNSSPCVKLLKMRNAEFFLVFVTSVFDEQMAIGEEKLEMLLENQLDNLNEPIAADDLATIGESNEAKAKRLIKEWTDKGFFGPLEKVCGYRSTIKTLYCPFIKSKNG